MLFMENEKVALAAISDCSGCGACEDVCPTRSIKMQSKNSLHPYPVIDVDTCIACKKCMNTCPSITENKGEETKYEQTFYAAWHKDSREKQGATSGAIGTAIAFKALQEGYYVCGAAFNAHWELHHQISKDPEVIEKFKGSKYLQSNTSGIYNKIRQIIYQGDKVLFFGTPCQAEAVRRFIPENKSDSLLTCEIICHGVNSQRVWSDYINWLENKHSSRLRSYNFRSKKAGWGQLRVGYAFANNHAEDIPAYKNLFHYWFGLHLMLRESCFNCRYRQEQRRSDFTIGDFWGIEKLLPQLNTKEGISVLIGSTSQGHKFISKLDSIEKIAVETKNVLPVLKGFLPRENTFNSAELNRMKQFESDYFKFSFNQMAKSYRPPGILNHIFAALCSRFPI